MYSYSVAIVSYNAAAFIREALDSALHQTCRPAQLIVIDDSTDDTPAIVKQYEKTHPQVVRLISVPRCNVSVKRNLALNQMTGEYLSYLDADDIWMPHKAQRQLEVLAQSPDAVGAYSHYFDFRSDLDDCRRLVPKRGLDDPSLRDVVYLQNMSSSTILFRRTAAAGIRFDETRKDAEDTIFVAEMRLKGLWRLADEPLIAKRIHTSQTSASLAHGIRNVECRLTWLQKRMGEAPEHAAELKAVYDEIAGGIVESLEGCYWRREISDLKWMLKEARRICPQQVENSFLARTRLYPRWLYRLHDRVIGR